MLHEVRLTIKKVQRRLELIEPLVYRRYEVLPPFHCLLLPDASPLDPSNVAVGTNDSAWPIIEPNTYWGGWLTDYVLRTQFPIARGLGSWAVVALYLPLGVAGDFSHPESLAYIDGAALCLLRPPSPGDQLAGRVAGRPPRTCWPCTAGPAWAGPPRASRAHSFSCAPARVVQIDQPTRDFLATARVAHGIVQQLGRERAGRAPPAQCAGRGLQAASTRASRSATRSMPACRRPTPRCAGASPARAAPWIRRSSPPATPTSTSPGCGRSARPGARPARTFHTVMRLMEQFPDYHFTQSQPQLYEYVRQDYPELFEDIKQRVAEGRWEPIGGMWVEADCNLTGAESLARQFLLGRTFFREHFRRRSRIAGALAARRLWLCLEPAAADQARPGWTTSSPSRSAGTSTTACPTIASGGRGWTARGADPLQHHARGRFRRILCQHLQRHGHARAKRSAPGATSSRRSCSRSC